MNYNSVADNARGFFVQNTARKQVELVLDTVNDDGVTCIRSTSNASTNIVFLSYESTNGIGGW